jgi:NADPH-dependent curcumin reductase CurA
MKNFEYNVKRLAAMGESMGESMFELKECDSPALNDGEVRVRLHALSVDPAFRASMRQEPIEGYMLQPYSLGETVRSFGICRVVESRNPALAVGALVGGGFSVFPWRLYQTFGASVPAPLQNSAGVSETHFLGAAGMPGVTALLPIRELYVTPVFDHPHTGVTFS